MYRGDPFVVIHIHLNAEQNPDQFFIDASLNFTGRTVLTQTAKINVTAFPMLNGILERVWIGQYESTVSEVIITLSLSLSLSLFLSLSLSLSLSLNLSI